MSCNRCGSGMCCGDCPARYQAGQVVEVTLRGKIIKADEGRIFIEASRGVGYAHRIDLADATVTVADPVSWPPQAGDVWATTAPNLITEWFAVKTTLGIRLVPSDDSGLTIAPDTLKTRNPVLMRRRGQ